MQDFIVSHLRVEEADIQIHVRVCASEAPQQGGQAMQADVVARGQGQSPADVAVEVGQGAAGVVQDIEDLIRARKQGSTGFGQADLAA